MNKQKNYKLLGYQRREKQVIGFGHSFLQTRFSRTLSTECKNSYMPLVHRCLSEPHNNVLSRSGVKYSRTHNEEPQLNPRNTETDCKPSKGFS